MSEAAVTAGRKLFKPFVHPETGRVLLPAGSTLTPQNIKNFQEAGLLAALGPCIDTRTRFKDLDGFEIEIPELPDIIAMFNLKDPPPEAGAIAKRKALVVDDAAFMRTLLIKLLQPGGFECFEAANGREAIGKYAQIKPDVVTLDVNMPEIDGFATLQALRQLDPAAKIVMCTSSGHLETVQRAISAGASGFLKKPVTPESLQNAMKELGLPFPAAT
ncbi:MAG: Response regulator [Cyanobacteria bacterium RYN_339]|nr:Response regulator [Cyanobacteria bacterium RYN_339]